DQGSEGYGAWSYYHYIAPLLVMMVVSGIVLQLTDESNIRHALWFAFGSAAFLALVMTFDKLFRDHHL
ncbi:MAG: hypothetical protein WCC94_05500, partial [Candidatus Bathyarchaeia archaeon]